MLLPHAALQVTRQQEAAVWAPVGRASNSRAVKPRAATVRAMAAWATLTRAVAVRAAAA